MSLFPYRNGTRQRPSSLWRQDHQTAAAVLRVPGDADQAAALERLDSGSQGGPVHGQKRSHSRHPGWFRTVQREQQGELPVGEADRTEGMIEAPSQGPGGSLHVKTETGIADKVSGLKSGAAGAGQREIVMGVNASCQEMAAVLYIDINV
jgi:hypothetical protein